MRKTKNIALKPSTPPQSNMYISDLLDDNFEEIILNLLPDNPILLASLGHKVSTYMKLNNYEETTTTAFFTAPVLGTDVVGLELLK